LQATQQRGDRQSLREYGKGDDREGRRLLNTRGSSRRRPDQLEILLHRTRRNTRYPNRTRKMALMRTEIPQLNIDVVFLS
jgi:hypothetical protein